MTERSVDIRKAAMDLLARREHSVRELQTKLQRRFSDPEQVDAELQRLAEEGLQSDARYAEAYLKSRAEKGYGPLRIRQEMQQRGLAEGEIERAYGDVEINWLDNLQRLVERKYGVSAAEDFAEKARRARFLQYRGFSHDQIRDVLD